MVSIKYNSINYAKYLNSCDLNYKYYLQSINDTPVLDKIVFELPTNKFSNISTTEDDYQNRILLKCFLSFYFMNFKLPYLNCNKFKNFIPENESSSYQYSYLYTYHKMIDKYSLLLLLLNENDKDNFGVKNLTNFKKNLITNKKDTLNFKLEIQISKIIEYREIVNLFFNRAELQNLKLKLNFIFKNFKNKVISINELKNFFFFWNI